MTEQNINRWLRVSLAVLILSLIPMIAVALYSRPFADDFAYAVYTRAAWQEQHSLPALIQAVARQLRETMETWQGSFSAIVLFSLQPGIFGDRVYGISTLILVACFLLGHFVFFSSVLYRDKKTSLIVSSVVCLLLMQTMPHAFQGFYWWNGSSYYTLFYSLFLIQLSLLFRLARTAGKGRIRLAVFACLLGFLLGGGNLVTALLNMEITALWVALVVTKSLRGKDRRGLLTSVLITAAVLIFTAAGFLLNAAAPGNSVRMETEAPIPAAEAILKSFDTAFAHIGYWTTGATLTLLLLLTPFLWHIAGRHAGDADTDETKLIPSAL
ncbi:MAG: hypothetical protein IK096_07440, partial [Lachnospiraceae bacterium]|nr:hypothetical protein [Lachnospiraceae bacterium]